MLLSLIIEGVSLGALPSPDEIGVEGVVTNLVLWLKLVIEIVGALLIGIGVVITTAGLAGVLRRPRLEGYEKTRLTLSRFLALGLEFQLAADIIATAVAPSWTQIGKLGAIAVIRTGLNYFLAREIAEEQEAIDSGSPLAKEVPSES